jgi:alpha-beta hydrolase superfamily lysophospholipase
MWIVEKPGGDVRAVESPPSKPAPNQDLRIPRASIHRVEADGVKVSYREAGPSDAPVVLFLHGFPTSSFHYRELNAIRVPGCVLVSEFAIAVS